MDEDEIIQNLEDLLKDAEADRDRFRDALVRLEKIIDDAPDHAVRYEARKVIEASLNA
ncbi:hypothetical protein [Geothrix terrae]|uniref:hypothetical protein n=1 Tax=Geothrix terrae TaxID=2922720 RepID=UPI001FAC7684|nr:hypothetical protein [Geothrix terrae]